MPDIAGNHAASLHLKESFSSVACNAFVWSKPGGERTLMMMMMKTLVQGM
jgi:hypothetical protein